MFGNPKPSVFLGHRMQFGEQGESGWCAVRKSGAGSHRALHAGPGSLGLVLQLLGSYGMAVSRKGWVMCTERWS